MEDKALAELTATIVSAYVERNSIATGDLPSLIESTHRALKGLGNGEVVQSEDALEKPSAAAIRKSIKPDALISFMDGKPYKQLKRHLSTHGVTPDEYRQRFGLPKDYPMVAPSYSARRSELAKAAGLGSRTRGGGTK